MSIFKRLFCSVTIASMLLANTVVSNAASVGTIKNDNKYKLSAQMAEQMDYFDTAIVVNTDKTVADGLSASGLAGETNSPILFVSQNSIDDDVLYQLRRAEKVYIIGGTSAIGIGVENMIRGSVDEVQRIEGADRLDTSYKVYKEIERLKSAYDGEVDTIYIVNGWKGEADAMSIAHTAVVHSSPVLLTSGQTFPIDAKLFDNVYAIGGTSVISESLVKAVGAKRLGGADRFETNKQILNEFHSSDDEYYIVNGWSLIEPLVISPAIGYDAAVMFADNNSDKALLHRAKEVVFVGNISQQIQTQTHNILNQPQENKNAVSKAYDWASYDDSKEEIREMLKYQKFNPNSINYAMNILRWDFNMNALNSARTWRYEYYYSLEETREMLESKGFTQSEINYAMNNL